MFIYFFITHIIKKFEGGMDTFKIWLRTTIVKYKKMLNTLFLIKINGCNPVKYFRERNYLDPFLSTEDGCLGDGDCATDNICHGACEAHYRCVVKKQAPYCYRPINKIHSKYSVKTLMTEKNRISFKAGWFSKLAKNISKSI